MYEFYMDGVRLPVTPSSLTIKISNQNKTINLINEGQRNIIKTPGLSKYSFNALLPNREYPFACYRTATSRHSIICHCWKSSSASASRLSFWLSARMTQAIC